ncbi:MAG: hypothetical protein GY748_23660, partial [Planctomycetaceae bacterium]|nr:hypothetical protein [Planctomycetaceae bacterium]
MKSYLNKQELTMTKTHEIICEPKARSHEILNTEVVSEDNLTLRFSLSSEFPVRRYNFARDEHYMEVLSHRSEDVDFSRLEAGAAFRDGHGGDQIGIMSNPELRDDKLFVTVRFSPDNSRAKLIYNDMKNGIRRNVSVAPVYTGPGIVTPKNIDNLRAIRFPWRPVHGATVADPADPTVGVGRSEPESGKLRLEYIDETINRNDQSKEKAMSEETKVIVNEDIGAAPERSMVTEPVDTKAIVADERHRISEIAATGKAFNME